MTEKFATPSAIEQGTPRTDAVLDVSSWTVSADFARQLERELACMTAVATQNGEDLDECREQLAERSSTTSPEPGESGWTAEQALRFYSEGRHFDVVEGRTRILDTGAVASDALKGMSQEYAAAKGCISSTVSWPDESGPVPTRPKIAPQAPVLAALILAQSALRQWTESYGLWSEQMPAGMSNKLPPGNHVRALEAIAEALELEKSSASGSPLPPPDVRLIPNDEWMKIAHILYWTDEMLRSKDDSEEYTAMTHVQQNMTDLKRILGHDPAKPLGADLADRRSEHG